MTVGRRQPTRFLSGKSCKTEHMLQELVQTEARLILFASIWFPSKWKECMPVRHRRKYNNSEEGVDLECRRSYTHYSAHWSMKMQSG
jgi:hypothetical protein